MLNILQASLQQYMNHETPDVQAAFRKDRGTRNHMPTNLENSAVATGLEKVSFHSNPNERQFQRMLETPQNYTLLTC